MRPFTSSGAARLVCRPCAAGGSGVSYAAALKALARIQIAQVPTSCPFWPGRRARISRLRSAA